MPPRKERPLSFALPLVASAEDNSGGRGAGPGQDVQIYFVTVFEAKVGELCDVSACHPPALPGGLACNISSRASRKRRT
jgi:hypothetical protein